MALFPAKDRSRAMESSGPRFCHLAFRAPNRIEFLEAQEQLRQAGVAFAFQDHEVSQSIYFRDPDGHQLEITTYDVPA
ncbi:MAG TPA: hypothetical protein DCY13_19870 [Verrucomicrobiales bacterium]|nr:hypothetical protein [Verrucomicrobiales bacterium]